jgi:hypothetical protein
MEWQDWLETPVTEIDPNHLRNAIRILRPQDFPNYQLYKEAETKLQQKFYEVSRFKSNEAITKNLEKEKESGEKTIEIITQNLPYIVFEINNRPVTIDKKTLKAKIRYSPCGHEEPIDITDLLFYPRDKTHEWAIKLSKWQVFLNHHSLVTGRLNCGKCLQDSQKLRETHRIEPANPMGFASWTLRILR